MLTFEVCKDKDYPQYTRKITNVWDIESAVEKAAEGFCHEDAEYSDFDCFARIPGESNWRTFHVTIESQPVFYASELS